MTKRGRWNKIEEFYKWICLPNPIFIDIVTGVLACIITLGTITLIGWLVCKLFGWYLIPIFLIALAIIAGIHLVYAHRNCDGGIKGWWKDKP